jgi:hypothetical protein
MGTALNFTHAVTPQNFSFEEDVQGEVNNLPSCTIPDQSFSLPELIERFVRGQALPAMGTYEEYDGDDPQFDDFSPHPNTMDLSERQDYGVGAQAEVDRLAKKYAEKPKEVTPVTEVKKEQ